MLSYSTKKGISGCIVMIRTDLQSRLLENTATVEREESDVTRAGSQATLLAVYTIYTIILFYLNFLMRLASRVLKSRTPRDTVITRHRSTMGRVASPW